MSNTMNTENSESQSVPHLNLHLLLVFDLRYRYGTNLSKRCEKRAKKDGFHLFSTALRRILHCKSEIER